MKLKELDKLDFGIVGKIQIMRPARKLGDSLYNKFENIKEAAKEFGELQVFQIFGTPMHESLGPSITIVLIEPFILDHPESH